VEGMMLGEFGTYQMGGLRDLFGGFNDCCCCCLEEDLVWRAIANYNRIQHTPIQRLEPHALVRSLARHGTQVVRDTRGYAQQSRKE
jgi:hypothetical protein